MEIMEADGNADDVCLLSQKRRDIMVKLNYQELKTMKVGLIIDRRKTKTMKINGRGGTFEADREQLEEIEDFTNLGSVI